MDMIDTNVKSEIDFNNTEVGFSYKSDQALYKARLLFSLMGNRLLVKIGAGLTPLALKWKFPVKRILKHTIFQQFVGGETLADVREVLALLNAYQVKAIIDFGVEGKEDEKSFEDSKKEFLSLIDFAAKNSVPYISIKISGLAPFYLLEKINKKIIRLPAGLTMDIGSLGQAEKEVFGHALNRIQAICDEGAAKDIGILIDAEESWIQDTIDAIAQSMMERCNKIKPVIYNTIQFYRTDRLEFLQYCLKVAAHVGYKPGLKIVRGAYMEKERARALTHSYASPIHQTKEATDADFNTGLLFCIERLSSIGLVVATHNELSTSIALGALHPGSKGNGSIHFSQLYGMSDNITYNLAKAGFSVSKYLPYGPLEEVIPYLMRRAQENTSVSGQTSRELYLVKREIERRSDEWI